MSNVIHSYNSVVPQETGLAPGGINVSECNNAATLLHVAWGTPTIRPEKKPLALHQGLEDGGAPPRRKQMRNFALGRRPRRQLLAHPLGFSLHYAHQFHNPIVFGTEHAITPK